MDTIAPSGHIFMFKVDEYVDGISIEVVGSDSCNKISVDVSFGNLYLGSYDVLHKFDIDDDHLGKSTSFFETCFRAFKTTEMIKVMVKTKLRCTSITMELLTSEVD